ncbi:MAG: MoaD/ThiS family protein [Candidatus Lernaella stagnicola]|nr:MoaD/ThiS family protein [Candidatus Lernaella stagnicola]
MPVEARFFSSLRAAAGVASIDIAADTVRTADRVLRERYANNSEFLRLLQISNVILNGDNVLFLKGPRTALKDGDELSYFPPLGGG